jgi:hypothetical protein
MSRRVRAATDDEQVGAGFFGQLRQPARHRRRGARRLAYGAAAAHVATRRGEKRGSVGARVRWQQPERSVAVDVREDQLAAVVVNQPLRERERVAVALEPPMPTRTRRKGVMSYLRVTRR